MNLDEQKEERARRSQSQSVAASSANCSWTVTQPEDGALNTDSANARCDATKNRKMSEKEKE